MAHHQHHGANYDDHVAQTLQSRPAASHSPTLPLTLEDEVPADADEPPENPQQIFTKAMPRPADIRRTESLLTKAFHTDSESHEDEQKNKSITGHNPSMSSTCSTTSRRSTGDFTSEDGHTSPGTRASTPNSPQSAAAFSRQLQAMDKIAPRIIVRQGTDSSKSSTTDAIIKPSEPVLESELGRKRCISFACVRKDQAPLTAVKVAAEPPPTIMEPKKRPCALKFLCPSRTSAPKSPVSQQSRKIRMHSPAPVKSSSPILRRRVHRDSDTTVKNESPKSLSPLEPAPKVPVASRMAVPSRTEATRFHEFCGSDDEVEDWIQESTCHRSRLTVTDTLKKENVIRQLAEEAEEEALEEEEQDEEDDAVTDFLSGEEEIEDAGFQTDDEEGFAASDDDSDDNSDYEWWAPRRSPTLSPFVSSKVFRPSGHRIGSISSLESHSLVASPHARATPSKMSAKREAKKAKAKATRPVAIRSCSSELPDSTDFICGTLDEDRPLEQAYLDTRKQREAASHRPMPQDIDPTFPTSDPELENDDEEVTEEEDEVDDIPFENVTESDRGFPRRLAHKKSSPHGSARRLRSPPPAQTKRGRSPAPRGMFHGSPKRMQSPPPNRTTSPPPSPGSTAASPLSITIPAFGLGMRNHELTHTASLPRSPHPFSRRRRSSNMTATNDSPNLHCDEENDESDADEDKPYTRGAIDIVQGLEQKRLKRRERFYKQYCKREERKKHHRRPQPGKGAERMRQVGIECAVYRGKRILSV